MAKISEILKELGLPSPYTDKVTRILKNSPEYGNKVTEGFLGATVEGSPTQIANYVREVFNEDKRKEQEINLEERKKEQEEIKRKNDLIIYFARGCNEETMEVYEDRIVSHQFVAFSDKNAISGFRNGETTIFYYDIIGIRFKEYDVSKGFFYYETPRSDFLFEFDNSDKSIVSNMEMKEIHNYIINQIALHKKPCNSNGNSAADEIRKYKELFDIGAITQDEYEVKKKQLLNE